jgi:hypothetical protein
MPCPQRLCADFTLNLPGASDIMPATTINRSMPALMTGGAKCASRPRFLLSVGPVVCKQVQVNPADIPIARALSDVTPFSERIGPAKTRPCVLSGPDEAMPGPGE